MSLLKCFQLRKDDAVSLKPDSADWLTWVPGASVANVIKTLNKVHGGRCYVIDLGGTADVTWAVVGRPVLRPLEWLNASYSLVGLPVDPAVPTTFAEFFAGSIAHQGVNIRRLSSAGQWVTIPASTQITRNEAYWIYANGISSFQGRGSVQVDNQGLLDFGGSVAEHQIVLCNNTTTNASFTISTLPASVPLGAATGGAIALSLWHDATNSSYGWEPLTNAKTVTVLANTKKPLRLAVRRGDMTWQGADHPFSSLLRITGLGALQNIGLRAQLSSSPFAGLWSGQCIIRNVNEPASLLDTNALQPTASEASLRLLLLVATNGAASLLREAYVFWLDGLTDLDGTVTEPGRFLVAGSDAEFAQLQATYGALSSGRLKGAAVRDGINVPRRFSSVGFSFTSPQPMTGVFASSGGSVSNTIVIGFNDDLNPYKHRYHPDHDNLLHGSALAGTPVLLPEGQESYTISRQIALQFQTTDPEQLRLSGWGDSVVGGVYSETITGLHRNPVKVSGTFRLTKVVSQ